MAMEIRGNKAYLDGRKVFEHWKDDDWDDNQIDSTWKPVSFREYRKRYPDNDDRDYQFDVQKWWVEFKSMKADKCEEELLDRLCFEELENFSPVIARQVRETIKHRCRVYPRVRYSLFW